MFEFNKCKGLRVDINTAEILKDVLVVWSKYLSPFYPLLINPHNFWGDKCYILYKTSTLEDGNYLPINLHNVNIPIAKSLSSKRFISSPYWVTSLKLLVNLILTENKNNTDLGKIKLDKKPTELDYLSSLSRLNEFLEERNWQHFIV